MPEVTVSYPIIILAVLAKTAVGFLWYSPLLFGNLWISLSGVKATGKEDMKKPLLISIIAAFITAFILAHILKIFDATTIDEGVIISFWLWLGFVASVMATHYAYGKKPLKLYLIDVGHSLVAITTMGGILAVWG